MMRWLAIFRRRRLPGVGWPTLQRDREIVRLDGKVAKEEAAANEARGRLDRALLALGDQFVAVAEETAKRIVDKKE